MYSKVWDKKDYEGAIKLWQTVLIQVLDDLDNNTNEFYQEIIDWSKSEDFEKICDMAGVCPIEVKKRIDNVKKN